MGSINDFLSRTMEKKALVHTNRNADYVYCKHSPHPHTFRNTPIPTTILALRPRLDSPPRILYCDFWNVGVLGKKDLRFQTSNHLLTRVFFLLLSLNISNRHMDYFAHETAVVDEKCNIGKKTKIRHFSHIMSNCTIGEGCNIGQNVVVSPGVILGKNVKIQNNVSIYTGVICEDDVFLGPSMVFTNVINPRSAINRKSEYMKTIVKKGATIGANATIVCGHNIGEYAFIGAGAVITKEVPAYALMVGNPAQQIGWMSEYGHRLEFDQKGIAICPESNEKYVLKNNQVNKVSS